MCRFCREKEAVERATKLIVGERDRLQAENDRLRSALEEAKRR